MPTSGPSLRRERRLADITTVALSAQMKLSRGTLWTLERSAAVDPDRAAAYREALKTLRDAKSAEPDAA